MDVGLCVHGYQDSVSLGVCGHFWSLSRLVYRILAGGCSG